MRTGIKIVLAFVFSLLFEFQAKASCAAEHVGISPREGSITRNPVFLLDFDEREFNLSNKWSNLEFYLLTNKKCEIKVELVRKVSGVGPGTQLLLKPAKMLNLSDSVRLQVRFKKGRPAPSDEAFRVFQGKVDNKQWQVTLPSDLEPVAWRSEPTWQEPDFRTNSLNAFSVRFNFQVEDSNPVYYEFFPGKTVALNLFEIEIDGHVFYAVGGGPKNQFSIYRSDCGGNFYLKSDKQYEANITALDFSGNRSKELKRVAFNTFMR